MSPEYPGESLLPCPVGLPASPGIHAHTSGAMPSFLVRQDQDTPSPQILLLQLALLHQHTGPTLSWATYWGTSLWSRTPAFLASPAATPKSRSDIL